MAHGKHGLDQPADSRRGVQMADVRLGATQGAEAASLRALAEGAGERGYLDWVAERRRGAVRFNIGDLVRADSRHGLSCCDYRCLAIHAGSHVTDLCGPIVIYREAANHGIDPVAVGDRVFQRLSSTTPTPCPNTVPVASASKGGNGRRATHAAFLKNISAMLRKRHRDASANAISH